MENLKQEIFELEQKLASNEIRKSKEELSKLLSDDFFEFAKDGNKYGKEEILGLLSKNPVGGFEVQNHEIFQLGEDSILSTFQTYRKDDGKRMLCSGIWKKYEDGWKLFFFQGTLVD